MIARIVLLQVRGGEGRGGEGRGGRGGEGRGGEGRGGEGGREGGREGWMDACYTYSNRYVHSLSPRHVECNYVSRHSIVSRRTRVSHYVRPDVDILRHPDSLTKKLPELVSKLVLSIPV